MTTSTPKTTATKPTCFVIQSSHNPRLDRLYEEIFRVAIAEGQLTPYRPAINPGRLPALETVAEQIRGAAACFADLTDESPYTWFALGCAAALGKPLCLVACSSGGATSLAAAYPETIHYPALPLPSDYQRLQQQITSRLLLIPDSSEVIERKQTVVISEPAEAATTATIDLTASTEEIAEQEQPTSYAEEAAFEPLTLAVADVRVHELLALSIIARGLPPHGTTLRLLALEMHKFNAAQATSLSLNGLVRKRLVERKQMDIDGDSGSHTQDCLFVTAAGRAWIETHHLDLTFTPPPLDAEPEGLMDLIHAL
jgi:hypothetical protein